MTNTQIVELYELKKSILRGETKIENLSTQKLSDLLKILSWSKQKEKSIIVKIVKVAKQRGVIREIM